MTPGGERSHHCAIAAPPKKGNAIPSWDLKSVEDGELHIPEKSSFVLSQLKGLRNTNSFVACYVVFASSSI